MTARARTRALSLLACLTLLVSISPLVSFDASGQVLADGGGRWSFNQAEQCLMHKINKARARKGLRRLRPDKQIGVVARRHAQSMAANYSVFHDYNMDDEITHWKRLGQNSGSGGSCKRMFRSEERRVGKEWKFREGGGACIYKVYMVFIVVLLIS